MNFVIEPVKDTQAAAGAAYVREEVFGREWRLQVPSLPASPGAGMLTLIARLESQPEPVAVLTVMETTGDLELHRRLGLTFDEGTRIARYTQLAVLKPYRGLNLPVQLVLAARRQFVVPRHIDHTWLLFDAERAASSSFCQLLGFRVSSETFETEYGCSRVLIRKDGAAIAGLNGWRAQDSRGASRMNGHKRLTDARSFSVARILADEWVAQ